MTVQAERADKDAGTITVVAEKVVLPTRRAEVGPGQAVRSEVEVDG